MNQTSSELKPSKTDLAALARKELAVYATPCGEASKRPHISG